MITKENLKYQRNLWPGPRFGIGRRQPSNKDQYLEGYSIYINGILKSLFKFCHSKPPVPKILSCREKTKQKPRNQSKNNRKKTKKLNKQQIYYVCKTSKYSYKYQIGKQCFSLPTKKSI